MNPKTLEVPVSKTVHEPPFKIGDYVVPRFVPIDEEGTGPNPRQIKSASNRLRVRKVEFKRIKQNSKYLLHFEGTCSMYDACFFMKAP